MFGSTPVYSSNGDFSVLDGFMRKANSISDSPVLSLFTNMPLFVLSRSFIVLIIRSILPFPRWSRIVHSTCFFSHTLQKSLRRLLLNIVAGSVLIILGIPCQAMYSCRKSRTFSAVGFRKNFASGQPE